uniref:Uncharacterized protein n=1 Tax=Amphimedon queenslandica TaxID=400682 RepID=A0A1X7SDJ9_AMPQE
MSLLVLIVAQVPIVSFESTAVSIPEGTSADVCLTIDGLVFISSLLISLGATDQSAIAPDDYTAPSSVTYFSVMGYVLGTPSSIIITIPGAPPPPPCPCKDRIATLACKDMENNGEYLPMPCRELLGNNP